MIRSERQFPVPRDSLFRAFADPATLAAWWGPHGSVNVFEAFELRPGGTWRFIMHAADGTAYLMTHEFVEVSEPERVAFRHLQAGHNFELRMDFEAVGPDQSRLRWSMQFADGEEESRVRPFVMQANEENFDRLEAVLGTSSPPTTRGAPP